jgi:RNase P subunit RPR2
MIESKLIQVNKKKIAYIFVVTINVVYLRRDRERSKVNMINLYSVPVGITVSVSVKRLRCGLLN